jgi:predicted TIM-barrel fold metal-dependent hydrolase
MRKLDAYAHIFPPAYFERMKALARDSGAIKRWLNVPVLYDLQARLDMMERFPGYQQVLTLSNPPVEFIAGPDASPALARLANEGMAEIRDRHPDKFPAFVASLPMNNMPAALEEMEYAITKLGARGVQVFTNVNGRPLDEPEFWPIFEQAVKRHDVPVWMHPARGANVPDYASETKSKFEIWWTFGWPYETSAAMTRMVFSGFFDRLPTLRVITHHMGAMIPFFDGRVGPGLDQFGSAAAPRTRTTKACSGAWRSGRSTTSACSTPTRRWPGGAPASAAGSNSSARSRWFSRPTARSTRKAGPNSSARFPRPSTRST